MGDLQLKQKVYWKECGPEGDDEFGVTLGGYKHVGRYVLLYAYNHTSLKFLIEKYFRFLLTSGHRNLYSNIKLYVNRYINM